MSDSAGRMSRNRENTRARLFEAAANVFAEIGVDAATVEVITERAGFSRGAFYSNFESKDELFFDLMTWVSDAKLGAVGARVQELDREGLREMSVEEVLERILDAVLDEPLGIRLMSEFRSRAMRDTRTADAYLAWLHGMETRVEGIVADIARGTGIRLTMPSTDLAQIIMFIWEGTSVQAVIEGRTYDELTTQVCDRTVAIVAALVNSQSAGRDAADAIGDVE